MWILQKNNKDLKFFIYNKLLKYLSSDSEDQSYESKKYNYADIKSEKTISFNIKSSYHNLNHLTKGNNNP